MTDRINRRDFLKLAGFGGVVFASGLAGYARAGSGVEEFHFVQLSDSHWGFKGPKVNPDAAGTLPKAVAAVNALREKPDFVMFTGDLTHSTDDPKERRARMRQFKEIVARLEVPKVHFIPGENDAALDGGEAFREFFGDTHYSFDHKGVHFVALDNVSDPRALLGPAQLSWLKSDLARLKANHPIVVFAHRPLFALYPQWDWNTRDGQDAVDILMPYQNVTVFYGHIHQENHHKTGHIAHHAATSLIFPLPAPGSVPKRAPVPWDAAHPYRGLGFREVEADTPKAYYKLDQYPIKKV